ncbi:MAG: 8-amino-7-oxononanoate synthase, partial [Limisphaerales bacterium]
MSSKLWNRIEQLLAARKKEGFFRTLRPQDVSDEQKLIDFSSNDYLGIARSGMLSEHFSHSQKPNTTSYKGATGSRLLTGHTTQTAILEDCAAAFHKMGSGLFYTSGYHANTGLISTVARRGDYILYDKLVHASIREGIALSNAQSFSFRHNKI